MICMNLGAYDDGRVIVWHVHKKIIHKCLNQENSSHMNHLNYNDHGISSPMMLQAESLHPIIDPTTATDSYEGFPITLAASWKSGNSEISSSK